MDFVSYLMVGGIPSRSLIEQHDLPMTEFVSDDNDHKNNVWDKVFVNPLDFGNIFKKGNGVPTVYGPITFIFKPQALLAADNVAICLRSTGCEGFDRINESLKTIEEVDRIFFQDYTENPYTSYKNSFIKFTSELREEFNREYVSNPVISLEIDGDFLEFNQHFSEVIVDPYSIGEVLLVDKVTEKMNIYEVRKNIRKRGLSNISWTILPEIVNVLLEGLPNLNRLEEYDGFSDDFRGWIQQLKSKGLDQQWLNYG